VARRHGMRTVMASQRNFWVEKGESSGAIY
jgi:hypothetical protein